eukprot:10011371-Alexandrium_andersonii.AAC.1
MGGGRAASPACGRRGRGLQPSPCGSKGEQKGPFVLAMMATPQENQGPEGPVRHEEAGEARKRRARSPNERLDLSLDSRP